MIHLRRPDPDDAIPLYEAVRETLDDLVRWMPWCRADYSLADAREWIASQAPARDKMDKIDFAIVGNDRRFLGCCGAHQFDWPHGTAQLGYWVRSSCRNQGVATRAVQELIAHAFGELDLHRLELLVADDNRASQRVAVKAGATREARLRERLLLNGHRHDALLFVVVREEKTAPPSARATA